MTEITDPAVRTGRGGRRRGRPAGNGAPGAAVSVQSLDRALNLIEEISRHEHGITLTDLATRTGLPPSTAHRLLKSLEHRDYLRHDEERGLWFVGVKAFTVGSAFVRARDIVNIARPIMYRLVEQVDESVNLAVLDRREAVYLSQVECRQMIRAHALPGARAPLHCSGVGKALLAALPPERADAIIAAIGMAVQTANTITDPGLFRAELARVRTVGYAVDDEEQSLGMRCVAAAILDENADPAAAVSLTGPSARLTAARLPDLGAHVRRAADQIAVAIGGRRTIVAGSTGTP